MLANKRLPTNLPKPDQALPIRPQSISRFRPLKLLSYFATVFCRYQWMRLQTRVNSHTAPFQLHWPIELLSHFWYTAAHMLAQRTDLLPTRLCTALNQLTDVGHAVPFEQIQTHLENQLGTALEQSFQQIDTPALRATSSLQYHRAYLRQEQTWVTLKLHKPHTHKIMQQDMALFQRLTNLFTYFAIRPELHWHSLNQHLQEHVRTFLDFKFEAATQQRLQKHLQSHPLYVADIFPAYLRQQVLVSEYIAAPSLADYHQHQQNTSNDLTPWLIENNIQPSKLSKRLFNAMHYQTLEMNLFPSQLHPENLLLLRDNRLAIIDGGATVSLDQTLVQHYTLFLRALAQQRYTSAAEYALLFIPSLPNLDVADCTAELIKLWRTWETQTHLDHRPYTEKSIRHLLQCMRALPEYPNTTPWAHVKVSIAWRNMDTSLQQLAPNMHPGRALKRYFQAATKRASELHLKQIKRTIPHNLAAMQQLPRQFSEYAFYQQLITHRQALTYQTRTHTSDAWIHALLRLFSGFLCLLFGYLGGAFLYQHSAHSAALLGPQITHWIQHVPTLNLSLWGLLLGGVALTLQRTLALNKRLAIRQHALPT